MVDDCKNSSVVLPHAHAFRNQLPQRGMSSVTVWNRGPYGAYNVQTCETFVFLCCAWFCFVLSMSEDYLGCQETILFLGEFLEKVSSIILILRGSLMYWKLFHDYSNRYCLSEFHPFRFIWIFKKRECFSLRCLFFFWLPPPLSCFETTCIEKSGISE